MNYYYRISGLTVSSEIPLPGAYSVEQGGACDVVMRQAAVPEHLENPSIARPRWEVAGDLFLLRAPGAGRFLLRGGRDIAFEVEAGALPADCAAFLIGRVFGTLLHQRGNIVLHASAVEAGGKAVLFCGKSGLGKSTLAGLFCRRGYPFLSDDVSAIDFGNDNTPYVYPDSRQLKLTAEAISALDLGARRGVKVLRRTDKYFVEPSVSTGGMQIRLGAIYVLGVEHPADPAGVHGLSAPEMIHAVRSNAYRPTLVKQTGQAQRYFEAAALIAGQIPVCRLTRGSGLVELPELADRVERHWEEIGLVRSKAKEIFPLERRSNAGV